MIYNGIYVLEENLIDTIKDLFSKTKHEHLLISLMAHDRSSVEKIITDNPNPIMNKNEFNSERSICNDAVKRAITNILNTKIDKDYLLLDITGHEDGFADDDDFYHFVNNVSEYDDSIRSEELNDFKRTLTKYKKALPTLEVNYKKQISETINRGRKYSDLINTLKPIILKSNTNSAIADINKYIKNVDHELPFTDDNTSFDKFVKELRALMLARLTIQLKAIEFSINHNNSIADSIVSKIKSAIREELKK